MIIEHTCVCAVAAVWTYVHLVGTMLTYLFSRYCVDILCPHSNYCATVRTDFYWFLAVSLINTLTRML